MDFRGQPEILNAEDYGLSGTEPVINQECMLVHEKSGHYVNLSGTAIIRDLLPPQAFWFGAVFYTICNFLLFTTIFSPNRNLKQ